MARGFRPAAGEWGRLAQRMLDALYALRGLDRLDSARADCSHLLARGSARF
jgi:hypothetical protein